MEGGAHFIPDVVWSALIAFAVAYVLYYGILRIPAREDTCASLYLLIDRSPSLKTATPVIVVLLMRWVKAPSLSARSRAIIKGLFDTI
jgi:hypothetical protein